MWGRLEAEGGRALGLGEGDSGLVWSAWRRMDQDIGSTERGIRDLLGTALLA